VLFFRDGKKKSGDDDEKDGKENGGSDNDLFKFTRELASEINNTCPKRKIMRENEANKRQLTIK